MSSNYVSTYYVEALCGGTPVGKVGHHHIQREDEGIFSAHVTYQGKIHWEASARINRHGLIVLHGNGIPVDVAEKLVQLVKAEPGPKYRDSGR
jgi:hypothetical protein